MHINMVMCTDVGGGKLCSDKHSGHTMQMIIYVVI